jgi:hypothetical protein
MKRSNRTRKSKAVKAPTSEAQAAPEQATRLEEIAARAEAAKAKRKAPTTTS